MNYVMRASRRTQKHTHTEGCTRKIFEDDVRLLRTTHAHNLMEAECSPTGAVAERVGEFATQKINSGSFEAPEFDG